MIYPRAQQGFTFVELIVVIACLTFIATLSTIGFKNMYDSAAIKVAHEEVFTALTDARALTLGSSNDSVFGVRVSSTTVTRFRGASYSDTDPENRTYLFEDGVTATGTLVATETDIVFTRLTGGLSTSGDIYLRSSAGDSTTTISLYASGLIE